MSLHDVDKGSDTRSSPKPNISDTHTTRSSDGTTAITNKQDGGSGAYVSTKDAAVKVNDGTLNRVFLGLLPDGSYGMKVSQDGYDVSAATDSELIFNSSYNMFKIIATGTTSIDVPDPFPAVTNNTSVVAHGLAFKPMVLAWIDVPATGAFSMDSVTTSIPASIYFTGGTFAAAMAVYITVDTTNITFNIRNVAGVGLSGLSPSWNIRYYIIQETAN